MAKTSDDGGSNGTNDLVQLKGGFETADRRLDRIPQFDPRSRRFGIAEVLPDKPQRSYTWRLPAQVPGFPSTRPDAQACAVLDQGREGACVGFGWSHELMARPVVQPTIDASYALYVYHEARVIDEWPGEDYSGTSVLAGAKIVQRQGHMKEYRWGFNLNDFIMALGYAGPVVLGLNWYTGMMNTDSEGFIHPTGRVEGGHCVAATGINIRRREAYGPNSWSCDWGRNGFWRMSLDDLERLLHEQGEQCIPTGRTKVAI